MNTKRFIIASAALAVVFIAGSAFAGSTKVSGNLVSPPTTMDAGVDNEPSPLAPDGVNDAIAVPAGHCAKPGLGACAADPNVVCNLAPGSGSDTACTACATPGLVACPPYAGCSGCPLCVEGLTGPDGVTAGDVPAHHIGSTTGKIQVQIVKNGNQTAGLQSKVQCNVKSVLDGSNAKVSTVKAGTCAGGVNDGNACTSNGQCGSNFFCISGDEYNCVVEGLVESNKDNAPPCAAPCIAALAAPSACGTGGVGFCAIGTCAGGSVRDGQACDLTGQSDCPGGFCDGLASTPALTGDETGFFAPAFSGQAYLLCPTQFQLGFPVELANGNGVMNHDLAKAPLSVCLPAGQDIDFISGTIHEPTTSGNSDQALLGFVTAAGATESDHKVPCAGISLPLPGSATGLPTNVGVGPVIAVVGVEATP